jgi:hypothetical protein
MYVTDKMMPMMPSNDVVAAFPTSHYFGTGRCYVRGEIEAWKSLLAGCAPPKPPAILELVPVGVVAKELHVHRRTLIRYEKRAAELRANAEAEAKAIAAE